jgi:hypothetical protein
LLKKKAHCCLEQREKGGIHLELFGKGEGEDEDRRKREFPDSMLEGLLVTLLSRLILPEGSTQHWKQGVTSTNRPWKP